MDLLQQILVELLYKQELRITMPGWDVDKLAQAVVDNNFLALQQIKEILENDALSDFDCVEEIMGVLERLGCSVDVRHDF